jgi:hypothetical protein
MTRKSLFMLCLLAALLILAGVVGAQEETTPVDNLCDAGQLWDDGRCAIPGHEGASELAWRCGYYIARLNDGRLAAGDIPTECAHLITPVSVLCKLTPADSLVGEGYIACIRSDQSGGASINPDMLPEGFPEELINVSVFEVRFVPDMLSPCPVVPGYFSFGSPVPAGFFEVFTGEERASLGLYGFMCFYINELASP